MVRDARAPWRGEDLFFQISETETGRALRTHRWKYGVTSEYHEDAPRSDVYREGYLYDLRSDPYEMVNLAGMRVFRELCDQLKARLLIDTVPRAPGQYRHLPTDFLYLQQQEAALGARKGEREDR